MHEIVLGGCTTAPLASYLKGLGLLRILAECDSESKASWRGESLHLFTRVPPGDLVGYLLSDYSPTPVLAPWNGGSGFFEKDNKVALQSIAAGKTDRLSNYRACLAIVEAVLEGNDRSASPKGAAKNELLIRVRNALPDAALGWFDAAILLTNDGAKYPPLLGTGGNDGRLDFTNNFMQRLLDLMDADSGAATPNSAAWLDLAMFGQPAPGLVKNAIGQFAPGQVGGPNATTGFDVNKAAMNPWDFVLMIEGAVLFAAAAVRRGAQDQDGVLSYPFTVRATSAGVGHLGIDDSAGARGELWMPLWSQPASYSEVRALLAEGRVAVGRRPARDALDFIRAVHRLGGYRGIDRFQRYGLLMRSGKAFLATPLERVQVTSAPESDWIDELEAGDWLSRFRRFTQNDNTARRFVTLRKRLEDLLFELARRTPPPNQVQALLGLLGEIQDALALSGTAREAVRPVPRLSARWVFAADDGAAGYRISRALAGLRGTKGQALPLRAQLFLVHPRYNDWINAACKAKGAANDPACRVRIHRHGRGDLLSTLIALLDQRLSLSDRLELTDKPLNSASGIDLTDLTHFLESSRMDARIANLLPGLALCEIPESQERSAGDGVPPAAFALCKLAMTPDATLRSLGILAGNQRFPVPPQLLSKLASGNSTQADQAIRLAWQRLRGAGLAPAMPLDDRPGLPGIDPRRLAAALLIPLGYGATGVLARSVLKQPANADVAADPPLQTNTP